MNIFGHSGNGTRQGKEVIDSFVNLSAQLPGVDLVSESLQLLSVFGQDGLGRAEAVKRSTCLVVAAYHP